MFNVTVYIWKVMKSRFYIGCSSGPSCRYVCPGREPTTSGVPEFAFSGVQNIVYWPEIFVPCKDMQLEQFDVSVACQFRSYLANVSIPCVGFDHLIPESECSRILDHSRRLRCEDQTDVSTSFGLKELCVIRVSVLHRQQATEEWHHNQSQKTVSGILQPFAHAKTFQPSKASKEAREK